METSVVVNKGLLKQPACYQVFRQSLSFVRGCGLRWWKGTWCSACKHLNCFSAKPTSVGMLVKEGRADVFCPEELLRSWDRMYTQSEKMDGCKHHANGDGLTSGQEESKKEGKESAGTGKPALEEEGLCQNSFTMWNPRENGGKLSTSISVYTVVPAFLLQTSLCSSEHGSSFGLNIGSNLQKLDSHTQCLVPTNAAGSDSPGHGSPKEHLQIRSFTICILAEWYFGDSPWVI